MANQKEVLSLKKASSVIFGFLFFVLAVAILIISKNLFFLAILCTVVGIIFLVVGISQASYDERLSEEGLNLDDYDLRAMWHSEMLLSIILSFVVGGVFFVSSIVLFFLDAQKYFLPLLFCDVVGATILVYGGKIQSYNKQVSDYEYKIDELKEKLASQNWAFQDLSFRNDFKV